MLPADPNFIYIALVLSLWLGAVAAHIPGTGLLELLTLAGIGGSLLLLGSMAVNWGAALVLVIGVPGFILLPFLLRRQHMSLALGGLAMQSCGGWLLFEGQSVSPLIIGLSVALPLAFYRYALLPTIERTQRDPADKLDEELTGATGRVVRALNPVGTVWVRGELWTASSKSPLSPGARVRVIERDGLNVRVARLRRKRAGTEEIEVVDD